MSTHMQQNLSPKRKWQDLQFRRLHHLDRCRMQQLDCLGSALQVQVRSAA